jgi:hypothetical protein
MAGTVIFLGAGTTKSCGGPTTNEILPQILGVQPATAAPVADSAGRLPKLQTFLQELFHVSPGSPKEFYPALPLLMSLLDTALEHRQALSPKWNTDEMRHAIELGIFDALEETLLKAPTNNHYSLLQKFFAPPAEPCVISTNYDVIIDTATMATSQGPGGRYLRAGYPTIIVRSPHPSIMSGPTTERC